MTLFERTEIACEMALNGSKEPAQNLLSLCLEHMEEQGPECGTMVQACAIELELALADFEPRHEAPDWDSMVRFDEFTR